jgi:hypothetical protein
MKEAKKRKKTKQPVHIPEVYTLGLGYNPADPAQSLDAVLGKHQAKYMNNIFTEMNKFTKTAVMTVVPELFAQLLNVLKQEKQRLIAEALDIEAGEEGEVTTDEVKNEIPVIPLPTAEDEPQSVDPEA